MVKELLNLKEVKEAECQKLEAENKALREALFISEKMSEGRKKIIDTMYTQVTILKLYLGEASVHDEKTKPKDLKSGSSTPEDWERSN